MSLPGSNRIESGAPITIPLAAAGGEIIVDFTIIEFYSVATDGRGAYR